MIQCTFVVESRAVCIAVLKACSHHVRASFENLKSSGKYHTFRHTVQQCALSLTVRASVYFKKILDLNSNARLKTEEFPVTCAATRNKV